MLTMLTSMLTVSAFGGHQAESRTCGNACRVPLFSVVCTLHLQLVDGIQC
jgi:hypothetical protein